MSFKKSTFQRNLFTALIVDARNRLAFEDHAVSRFVSYLPEVPRNTDEETQQSGPAYLRSSATIQKGEKRRKYRDQTTTMSCERNIQEETKSD